MSDSQEQDLQFFEESGFYNVTGDFNEADFDDSDSSEDYETKSHIESDRATTNIQQPPSTNPPPPIFELLGYNLLSPPNPNPTSTTADDPFILPDRDLTSEITPSNPTLDKN